VYRDENTARHIQTAFAQTYLWHGDGLLPDDTWVLIPHAHTAFASLGEIFVTHGGLSLDEMVVPFVEIMRAP
ncbi:MAG TPA: hypothetical protein VI451_06575, partial [Anaerolineales bacterium]|nr:hypothetical protein [Anaerolineales bacterium]